MCSDDHPSTVLIMGFARGLLFPSRFPLKMMSIGPAMPHRSRRCNRKGTRIWISLWSSICWLGRRWTRTDGERPGRIDDDVMLISYGHITISSSSSLLRGFIKSHGCQRYRTWCSYFLTLVITRPFIII